MEVDKPYSVEHGSFEDEMVACLSHVHDLFHHDNADVYERIAQAVRGSIVAASSVAHRKGWDGRAAFMALCGQYAGKALWEKMIRDNEDFLQNRKWTGNTNITLEHHVEGHRAEYVHLTTAAENVDYQIPNQRTRVSHLVNSIENNCDDAQVMTALANIRQNNPGM